MILGKDDNKAREKFDFELNRKRFNFRFSLGDKVSEVLVMW